MNRLVRFFSKIKSNRSLLKRYSSYLNMGEEPKQGDQSLLRRAALLSGGKSLDRAHRIAKASLPAWSMIPSDRSSKNVLLQLEETEVQEAINSLNRNGFWVSPRRIKNSLVDRYHENAKAELFQLFETRNHKSVELAHKDSKLRDKEMVFLGSDWVLNQELLFEMATCPNILNIVGSYLGTNPILNLPETWFSFPVTEIKRESAQNWHFDCDRVKWLKVFVYITDVDFANGPHSFVTTSHRDWKLKSEDSRFAEEQVLERFDSKLIKDFTGSRGTVIFEDTRGLHKGTKLTAGYRLILQLEFSTDSFGYIHPIFNFSSRFSKYLSDFPYLFPQSRYKS